MGNRQPRSKKLLIRRDTIRRLDTLSDDDLRGVGGGVLVTGVNIVIGIGNNPVDGVEEGVPDDPLRYGATTRNGAMAGVDRYC